MAIQSQHLVTTQKPRAMTLISTFFLKKFSWGIEIWPAHVPMKKPIRKAQPCRAGETRRTLRTSRILMAKKFLAEGRAHG
ncbi:hypothetical protein [Azotobacter armeniacus]